MQIAEEKRHGDSLAGVLNLVEECMLEKDQQVHNALIFSNREKILDYYFKVQKPILREFDDVKIVQKLMSSTSKHTLNLFTQEKYSNISKNFNTMLFEDNYKILYEALKSKLIVSNVKSFGYIEDIIKNENGEDEIKGFYVWVKI